MKADLIARLTKPYAGGTDALIYWVVEGKERNWYYIDEMKAKAKSLEMAKANTGCYYFCLRQVTFNFDSIVRKGIVFEDE